MILSEGASVSPTDMDCDEPAATAVPVEAANGATSNGHIQEASTSNNSVVTSANGSVKADPPSQSTNVVRPFADLVL